ncbi:MAG: peptide deformylase [Anaerolineales bacterium]|nr:peptide deformylase [Anaerolineales bacterium]MCS7248798.1 peptide deformylase [Anaerolineales bacterium]MDW8162611.1 peptide deformylase [Anaerolineales bacterium]MDW8445763.1 peptide deformylase [Anaerolineales bacterium]
MAIREIVTHPNPILRRKAHRVEKFDQGLQSLIEDMIETMRAAPGVGLAAPQVGVPLRLIVIEYGEDENSDAPPKLYVMANPEILRASSETELGVEGCLSIPGFVGEVERAAEILVRGQNRFGKPTKVKAKGWLARIFQHEIDHLNGILFIDRTDKVWKAAEEKEPAQANVSN